jgi:hypothetical protein
VAWFTKVDEEVSMTFWVVGERVVETNQKLDRKTLSEPQQPINPVRGKVY